jgi:hypothetical protein
MMNPEERKIAVSEPRVYIIRPAIFVPAILSLIAAISFAQCYWWYLSAIPFIWLRSICAQPNPNVVSGALAFVAALSGGVVFAFFKPLGGRSFRVRFSASCHRHLRCAY